MGKKESCMTDWLNPVSRDVEKNRVNSIVTIFFTKQFLVSTKIKKPQDYLIRIGAFEKWQRHTLPHVTAVPSALMSLTSLFGMGRGGPHRYSRLKS
jgi:hypothetical protein